MHARLTVLTATLLALAIAGCSKEESAAPAANAADTPPNPLQKAGWILDRHDEFNGALDPNLWRGAITFRTNPVQYVYNASSDAGLQNIRELLANGYVLVFGCAAGDVGIASLFRVS